MKQTAMLRANGLPTATQRVRALPSPVERARETRETLPQTQGAGPRPGTSWGPSPLCTHLEGPGHAGVLSRVQLLQQRPGPEAPVPGY